MDMALFAKLAGFKNQASAAACWGPVRKKLMAVGAAAATAHTGDAGPSSHAPSSIPKAVRKRKSAVKSASVAEDDLDSEEYDETPAKKSRLILEKAVAQKAPTKKAAVTGQGKGKAAGVEVSDDDDEKNIGEQPKAEMDKNMSSGNVKDEEASDGYF